METSLARRVEHSERPKSTPLWKSMEIRRLIQKIPQNSSTNDASDQSIQFLVEELAMFQLFQESLKSSATPIIALVKSSNPTICFISLLSKWVIDFGATNHMTCNPSLFFTFQPHLLTSTSLWKMDLDLVFLVRHHSSFIICLKFTKFLI